MATNEQLKKSAQRIKTVRMHLGISMDAFAKQIDSHASSGTVANWEVGKNQPSATRIQKIAKLGDTNIAYLKGLTDDPTPKSPQPQSVHFTVDPYWAIRQALSIYVSNNLAKFNPRQEPALNWFLISYVEPNPNKNLPHLTNNDIDKIIDQYLTINHETTFTLDDNPYKHQKLWSLIEAYPAFKRELVNVYRTNTLTNSYVIDIPNNTIHPVEYGHHAETVIWLLSKQMPHAKSHSIDDQNRFISAHYALVGPHRFSNIKED